MKRIIRTVIFVVIISFACAISPAKAVELPPTAKLVPPETVLLVDIDDFSKLRAQFEKNNFYKLYKDPAMAAFVENFKTKLREKAQKLDENNIFRTFYEAGIWPQGRVALALVLDEQTKDANQPPVTVITQWGEDIDKIKEAIDKMLEKNLEYGGHQKSSENYRDVSIETVVDEGSSVLHYCFIGDSLIATQGNIELLKFIIAHIKGAGSPTLADDADYTATSKAIGPYHDADIYLNIKQIVRMLIAEDTTDQAKTIVANLGFDNVTFLGASVGLGRCSGSATCGKSFLKINGAKKGVVKMLEMESTVLKAPRFIPASVYSASFLNLDIKSVYTELYNILYSFNPQYAGMMHMPLLPPSPDGQPGLQIKSDIIDHMGSQIVITQKINKPFSGSAEPTESVFAVALSNPKALEKSLSLFHETMIAPTDPEAKRELLGHTIYLVPFPALPFLTGAVTPTQAPPAPQVPKFIRMAFTVTDAHLIFAGEPAVEQAIRTLNSSETPSLASARWFASSKSSIPSTVGLACLQDDVASSEFFWWMLKQSSKDKAARISPGAAAVPISALPGFDSLKFDLLPEFDSVRKYFGLTSFYGISRPDGFFFEFKYLAPPRSD